MPEVGRWLQSARSLLLALRVIMFEKTTSVAALLWSALFVVLIAPLVTVSTGSAMVLLIVAVALYFPFARWAYAQRFRLIRPADRVEFAELGSVDATPLQGFAAGIVLQKLCRDDVARTGVELAGQSLWYYLVRTADKTAIVPFDWIISIELDEGMK